jgi:hypothetical protein
VLIKCSQCSRSQRRSRSVCAAATTIVQLTSLSSKQGIVHSRSTALSPVLTVRVFPVPPHATASSAADPVFNSSHFRPAETSGFRVSSLACRDLPVSRPLIQLAQFDCFMAL